MHLDRLKVKINPMTAMMDLIQELWTLKRDIVSDDFDKALYRLASELPMKIYEYPPEHNVGPGRSRKNGPVMKVTLRHWTESAHRLQGSSTPRGFV